MKEITDFGAEIVKVAGDYEEAVKVSRLDAEEKGVL